MTAKTLHNTTLQAIKNLSESTINNYYPVIKKADYYITKGYEFYKAFEDTKEFEHLEAGRENVIKGRDIITDLYYKTEGIEMGYTGD